MVTSHRRITFVSEVVNVACLRGSDARIASVRGWKHRGFDGWTMFQCFFDMVEKSGPAALVRIGGRNNGPDEYARGDRSTRDPDDRRLRCTRIHNYAHEQAQAPSRQRQNWYVPDAFPVGMQQKPPHPLAKRMEAPFPKARVAAQRVVIDRRRGSLGGGLHAKPAVLGENGHNAGDGAHRVGDERARARVEGHRVVLALALLLLFAHLVTGAVDLSGEADGEALVALDGLLEQQGAHDACGRADEVEREADEAEPVRHFA